MKRMTMAAMLALATVSGGAAVAADAQGHEGTEQDQALAHKIWQAMQQMRLVGDHAIDTTPHVSKSQKHGAVVEVFYASADLDGRPRKALEVKRNYGPAGVSVSEVQGARDKHLGAITIMYLTADKPDGAKGWFFVKYKPDGSLAKESDGTPMAGQVPGCASCHGKAPGNDGLYTTNHVQ